MLTHSILNQNNPLLTTLFNGSVPSSNTQNNMNQSTNTNGTSNPQLSSANNNNNNLPIVNNNNTSMNSNNLPTASSINDFTQEELIKHLQEKVFYLTFFFFSLKNKIIFSIQYNQQLLQDLVVSFKNIHSFAFSIKLFS